MRKLAIISTICILALAPILGGCGEAQPVQSLDRTESSYRRPDVKYYQYDVTTYAFPPEVADYPELTEEAARQLFNDCRQITGLGSSGTANPVNVAKAFDSQEYCNVYAVSDAWLSIRVRTFDARVVEMKNDGADKADIFSPLLDERGARERAAAIFDAVVQAEAQARASSPDLAVPEQVEYTEPVANGWGIGPNTGSWSIRWDRVTPAGIPYYVGMSSNNAQGKSMSLRCDGLFQNSTIYEALGCSDTVPAINREQAIEYAQPVLEQRLGNPEQAPGAELVYLVPDKAGLSRYSNPPSWSWPAPCYPKENCLAWVVRVSEELPLPAGAINHQPHAEVWVDALSGEIIGMQGW